MPASDLTALWLSLKLAGVSTVLLFLFSVPLAWWLARSQWRFKFLLEALLAMPLVLPPTVLGFYLLLFLGPQGPLARLLPVPSLTFSFWGLVIGSCVYSLPFVIQPIKNSFTQIDKRELEVAATLGAGPWDRFCSIVLARSRSGLLAATILGFAHTLGEFGVVLMIGGSIPGETRVVSIALYEHVEAGDYAQAHQLALTLMGLSFVMLVAVYLLDRPAILKKWSGRSRVTTG